MTTSQNERLWLNFRYARISQGMSQREVSEMAGISPADLSKVESGHCNVTINTLIPLCKVINLSLDKCVYGDDYRKMQIMQDIVDLHQDDEEYRKRICELFKQRRKEHGYTQADLSKLANVCPSRICMVEREYITALSDSLLYKLCKALNIELCELMML